MAEHNIYIQAINPPTVPPGKELLRLAPGPDHTEEMKQALVESLVSIWKKYKPLMMDVEEVVDCLPVMQSGQDRSMLDSPREGYFGPVSVAA